MYNKLANQYREATGQRNKDKLKLIIFGNFNPKDFDFAEVYPFNGEYFTDKVFDAILCYSEIIPKELFDLSMMYHVNIFHLTKSSSSITIEDIKKSKFLKLRKK